MLTIIEQLPKRCKVFNLVNAGFFECSFFSVGGGGGEEGGGGGWVGVNLTPLLYFKNN